MDRGGTPRRAGLVAALTWMLVLAGAPPAFATTWFAAPGGTGVAPCSAADPCGLTSAVASAPSGTRVVAGPGTYTLGPPLQVSNPILLRGPWSGRPAVLARSGPGPVVRVSGAGARVTDVTAEQGGPGNGIAVGPGALAGRIEAVSSGFGSACAPELGAVLRDSVCVADGSGSGVLVEADSAVAGDVALTNVTAVSRGDEATDSSALLVRATHDAEVHVAAANVIAHALGDAPDISSGQLGATAAVELTNSNYSTRVEVGGATITAPETGDNMTEPPVFVDAAAGDFREDPDSPTVDAGSAAAPSLGLLDADRLARIRGPAPDAGAYELVPPPDTRPPNVSIPVAPKGRIKTTGRYVDVTFELVADEDDVTFQCRINRRPVEGCSSPVTYRLFSERGRGAAYKLTVRAIDEAGNRSGRAIRQLRVIRVKRGSG